MDAATAKAIAENPEFDKPIAVLVRLLLQVKQSGTHGKTGVTVPHKNGVISDLVNEVKEHSVLN